MAYSRRTTQDGKTVMNKELYDNLQDGVDECKEDIAAITMGYDSTDQYFTIGKIGGSDMEEMGYTEEDYISPEDASAIFDEAMNEAAESEG